MKFDLKNILGKKDKSFSGAESEDQAIASSGGESQKVGQKAKPSFPDRFSGEIKYFNENLTPYLPGELIGGGIPYVPGMEDESVWNAASQACATEKVHYVYTIEGDRVWYLACPSTALASAPDSWCPLAAALPGNSEFWDKQSVYIYEKDGLASALKWDIETGRLQIFFGASRTILPRIQSMEANFITINPQIADVIPWRNQQLRTEQLARGTARMLVLSGILVSLCLLGFMVLQYIGLNFMDRHLEAIKEQTEQASVDLLKQATELSHNDVLKHTTRLQQLLDDLGQIDGTLVRYEVNKSGKLEWEALVTAGYSKGVLSIQGTAQPGIEPDGRIRIKGTN